MCSKSAQVLLDLVFLVDIFFTLPLQSQIPCTNKIKACLYQVIAMEEGRVCGVGRAGAGVCPSSGGASAVSRWARLAAEARAATARTGAGPPGGAARERTRLMRELTRAKFQRCNSEDGLVSGNVVNYL